jgi:hypothetical protein
MISMVSSRAYKPKNIDEKSYVIEINGILNRHHLCAESTGRYKIELSKYTVQSTLRGVMLSYFGERCIRKLLREGFVGTLSGKPAVTIPQSYCSPNNWLQIVNQTKDTSLVIISLLDIAIMSCRACDFYRELKRKGSLVSEEEITNAQKVFEKSLEEFKKKIAGTV